MPPTTIPFYLQSKSSNPPLRIGLLMDGPKLIRGLAEVIEHINASNFATLEFVVFHKPASTTAPSSSLKLARYLNVIRNKNTRRTLAFEQYLKMDKRLAAVADDPL